jgi:cation transport regulator ChaB
MPKTTRAGTPKAEEIPETLKRSPKKAQRTFAKAHDAAAEQYGEGERAHRTAFAALKRGFEKVGDHWEKKAEKGPSDEAAETPGRKGETKGGVDANASKAHLYDVATRLEIEGRSKMSKDELVEAIQKANARETRKASSR